jgi:hypothetical protein
VLGITGIRHHALLIYKILKNSYGLTYARPKHHKNKTKQQVPVIEMRIVMDTGKVRVIQVNKILSYHKEDHRECLK